MTMSTRKGLFTPKQEELLDELLEFKNKLVEASDGLLIRIADNKGVEAGLKALEAKYPDFKVREMAYEITDLLFDEVLEPLAKK